jgi:hypothetical protein
MLSDIAEGCRGRMPSRRKSFPTLLFLFTPLLHGCPGVQVTPGGSFVSGNGTASLTWDAPLTDTNGTPIVGLAGYHIYAGTDPDDLTLKGGVSGAAATSFEIMGLPAGTYYFAVTAYNVYGDESVKSNIDSKTF